MKKLSQHESNKTNFMLKKATDYGIYKIFRVVLTERHPKNNALIECVIGVLQQNNVADDFYNVALFTNPEEIVRGIQLHINAAYSDCKVIEIN